MAASELIDQTIAVPATRLDWPRQRHSYAFIAVIGIQIAIGPLFMLPTGGYRPDTLPATFGIAFAQCFLLGVWAALGGLSTLLRWGAIFAVYSFGLLTFVRGSTRVALEDLWDNALSAGLVGALLVAATAACLLPLRRVAGWRVDFDSAYHPQGRLRRGQISLMDFAAYSCVVSAMLAIATLVGDLWGDGNRSVVLIFFAMWLFVMASAAAPAYMMLRWPCMLAVVAGAVWTLTVLQLHSWIALLVVDLHFFGREGVIGPTQVDSCLAAFHGAVGSTVIVTLLVLRCCGLKLLVLREREAIALAS